MLFSRFIFSIIQVCIFVLSLVTDWYAVLTVANALLLLVMILNRLGKGIVLREIIALHSAVICTLLPLIGYAAYTRENALARLWVRYMLVPEDIYFGFILPAVTAFSIALCWPLKAGNGPDHGLNLESIITRAKNILLQKSKFGIYLLIIGVIMYFIGGFLPAALRFVSVLFFFSSFAGLLYVYYAPAFRHKKIILLLFVLFIIANALTTGMFTIVAYMSMVIISFLFLGSKASFLRKAVLFASGVMMLLVIQSVKPTYRGYTWYKGYEGNKAELFMNLMTEKISEGNLFSKDEFFWIYYRANQGFNISLVMRRIPAVQPHDEGENLLRSIASSLVPRFLWPDKPEAGGKFNMKYYAGITLRGWSTNIGPLGEAYGGFGVTGGIIYMFLLGAFIRWAYQRVFIIAKKIPLFIFWLPVLFYQITYSAETDTLQIFNSLLKGALFVWLLYKLVPAWFGIRRENKYIYPMGQIKKLPA